VMGTLVHATSRIAVGFVPFVGPALDFCECVTGKSWCLPSGQELSIEERIFSGAGFAVASVGPFWRGVKNVAIGPAAVAAEDIARMGEELATALHASRRTSFKTLRGAITSKVIDPFERKAALHLMQEEGRALIGVGDDGVRRVLGIPRESPPYTKLGMAPDFVSVTRGNKLAVSEAKGIEAATGRIDAETAVDQLTNAMNKLKDKGLAGDVDRVEILVPRGVGFKNLNWGTKDGYLFNKSTGKAIKIEGFTHLFIKVVEL
jgi:hypothetical protein